MIVAHLKLAAYFLGEASDMLSNHGCNDFELTNDDMTKEEMVLFLTEGVRLGCIAQEDLEEDIRRLPYIPAFVAAGICEAMLEEAIRDAH